jgi:hypothetical protein
MPVVRALDDRDLDAVAALHRAVGWTPPTLDVWNHLWRDNPARVAAPDTARGWVLVEQDRVVGYLANVVQQYRLDGRTLTAASAASLVVAPEFRGSSLQLYLAFVRQGGVELLLNTTAAPQVSQISEFLKFKRIPQPDYNRSCFWILRPMAFAPAALRKKGLPSWQSRLAGPLAGAGLALENALRGRVPRRPASSMAVRVLDAADLGAAFDDLWTRAITRSGARLMAYRDAATLRWHFASRGRPHPPKIVAAIAGDTVRGYAAIVRQDAGHLGLTRARLADLVVDDGDEIVGRTLVAAACDAARAGGASMLEAVGFDAATRRLFAESSPREIVDQAWPFLYRAVDPALAAPLATESAWRACLYDGDGSL